MSNLGFIQKRKYAGGDPSNGLSNLDSTQVAVDLEATILTPKIAPKLGKYSILINWGVSNIPWLNKYFLHWNQTKGDNLKILNNPVMLHNAIDKKRTLTLLSSNGVPVPSFTFDQDQAEQWFEEKENAIVFCRTKTNSFQGKGIVIARSKSELVPAPLYTLRVPKKWEYRVHAFHDKIVCIQQKKRLSPEKLAERGIEESDGLIRSWDNGYIFSKELAHQMDSQVIQDLTRYSIEAVRCLGLDFGAVDLMVTNKGNVRVLEVNTSPGIEGSTVNSYVAIFQEFIDENS